MTTLPPGSRYGIVQALRQCLEAGSRWGFTSRTRRSSRGATHSRGGRRFSPSSRTRSRPSRASSARIRAARHRRGLHGLAALEWTALEWRDVDRAEGVLRVERAFSYGALKTPKTKGSRRRVPLPARAAQALETLPAVTDDAARLPRRTREPHRPPQLAQARMEAVGSRPRVSRAAPVRPYDLRHSYAAWSLAAGVPAHDLARYMGTSLRMIDLTYGHLVRGSEEAARSRLDAFTTAAAEAAEGGTQ